MGYQDQEESGGNDTAVRMNEEIVLPTRSINRPSATRWRTSSTFLAIEVDTEVDLSDGGAQRLHDRVQRKLSELD
jgi:hypothetical protein